MDICIYGLSASEEFRFLSRAIQMFSLLLLLLLLLLLSIECRDWGPGRQTFLCTIQP